MDSLSLVATAIGLFASTSVTLLGGMRWMLARVEQRTSERFDGMDQRFDRMDQRFDRMDQRFDRMDAGTDERFAAVGVSLTEVKTAIARLEGPRPTLLIARG